MLDESPIEVLPRAAWVLSLYEDAAEAGGCVVSPFRRHSVGFKGKAENPERSLAEAARRARGRLRRYCVANGLNRLGTLTYAPPFCTDPLVVRRDMAAFFRDLRALLGGEPLPYAWVPELHKDGERFHVHFAVGRFVQRGLIQQAWGHGFVHIKLLTGLGVGSGAVAEARIAAGYLAKYVGKGIQAEGEVLVDAIAQAEREADGEGYFKAKAMAKAKAEADAKRPFGRHRYEVAQGFQPVAQRLTALTLREVFGQACDVMGARPSVVWDSSHAENWAASPAVWLQWAGTR